jgi:hypothetical protein
MQKKIKISIAAVAALMLVVLAVNLAMAATTAVKVPELAANADAANVQDNSVVISPEQAEDKEQLKQIAPATIEEAESSIYPIRTRFLMWTYDGVHIMWGIYGNGRFVGTDNLGKRCWGIYGRGVFAGFYDGEFFWGKYVNGTWKAEYLFGLNTSYGKYVVFPQPALTSSNAASP